MGSSVEHSPGAAHFTLCCDFRLWNGILGCKIFLAPFIQGLLSLIASLRATKACTSRADSCEARASESAPVRSSTHSLFAGLIWVRTQRAINHLLILLHKICPGLKIGLARRHHLLEELKRLCPGLEVGPTCFHKLFILLKRVSPRLQIGSTCFHDLL